MENVRGTVNRIELIGWLGSEPEQRVLASGAAVCNFRIATKRPGGRDDQGNRMFETDWITVEAWERLAERCMQSLHKGSRVRVIGSLRTDSWADKESGQVRYKSFVRASNTMFLDARPEAASDEVEEAEEEDVPF